MKHAREGGIGGIPLGRRGGIREVWWYDTHVPYVRLVLSVTVPLPAWGESRATWPIQKVHLPPLYNPCRASLGAGT